MTQPKSSYTYEFFSLALALSIAALCSLFLIFYTRFTIPFGVAGFIPIFFIPLISPNLIVKGAIQALCGACIGFLCSALALYFYSSYFIFLAIYIVSICLSSYFLAQGRQLLLQVFFLLTMGLSLYFSLEIYTRALTQMAWFVFNISLGSFLVIITYKYLWPILFHKLPEEQKKSILHTLTHSINDVVVGDQSKLARFKKILGQKKTILSLFSNYTSQESKEDLQHYSHFFQYSQKLPFLIENLHICMEQLHHSRLNERFYEPLQRMIEYIDHQNVEASTKAFEDLQTFYHEQINSDFILQFPIEESLNLFRMINQIEEILDILRELNTPSLLSTEREEKAVATKIEAALFKRTGVIALSTLLSVFAIFYFNLPGQFQGIISAIVIIAKPTIDGSFQWAAFRFVGTLFGGIIGIAGSVLIAYFTYFPSTLAFFFCVFLLLSYASIQFPRYHYVFIQAIFAYLFVTASTSYSEGDLEVLLYRLVGVVEGIIFSLSISAVFGFTSPLKKMNTLLRKHFNVCGTILTSDIDPALIEELKGVSQKQEAQLETLKFTPWQTKRAKITLPLFEELFKVLDEGLSIYSKRGSRITALLASARFEKLGNITKGTGGIFLKLSNKNICFSTSYTGAGIEEIKDDLAAFKVEMRRERKLQSLPYKDVKAIFNHLLFLENTVAMMVKIKETLLAKNT